MCRCIVHSAGISTITHVQYTQAHSESAALALTEMKERGEDHREIGKRRVEGEAVIAGRRELKAAI